MTFGEKQRLFEHIGLLEQIQNDVQERMNRLSVENAVLNRFRYHHVQSKTHHLLPKCFENDLFMQWCKFVQILNKCLKRCFDDGKIFHQRAEGVF